MSVSDTSLDEVEIAWDDRSQKKFLRFKFHGDLSEAAANAAIVKWRLEFQKIPMGTYTDLIWNCLDMKKYSSKAAKMWKEAMSEMKDKISCVWLVTDNTFIRMGARTVTFLLPVTMKVVRSEDEIK